MFIPTAQVIPQFVKKFLLDPVFEHPKINFRGIPYLQFLQGEFNNIDRAFNNLQKKVNASYPHLLRNPNCLITRVVNQRTTVRQICDDIITALNLFFSTNPSAPYKLLGSQSYNIIEARLNSLANHIDVLTSQVLDKNNELLKRLYKMRKCSLKTRLYSPKQMFHIPLDKRHYCSTMRFSIPRQPALYLANNLFICADEINARDINGNVQAARFQMVDKIRVLNLAYDNRKASNWAEHDIGSSRLNDLVIAWLLLYPFALASSVRRYEALTVNGVAPEYVLPQLLMEYVVYNKNAKLDGIRYISTKVLSLDCHINFYACWAFPSKSETKRGYDPTLCKKFRVTKGVRIPCRYQNKIDSRIISEKIRNTKTLAKKVGFVDYISSDVTKMFADVESRLFKRKVKKIHP